MCVVLWESQLHTVYGTNKMKMSLFLTCSCNLNFSQVTVFTCKNKQRREYFGQTTREMGLSRCSERVLVTYSLLLGGNWQKHCTDNEIIVLCFWKSITALCL